MESFFEGAPGTAFTVRCVTRIKRPALLEALRVIHVIAGRQR